MQSLAAVFSLTAALLHATPAYAIKDDDKVLRMLVNDGHAAFNRSDFASAVSRWREAYDSLPAVESTLAKRQMLLELLLRAYYELDTRGADLERIRSVLRLIESYRMSLGERRVESETVRDWYVTFQERAARLESEGQAKLLLAANKELQQRLASLPAECESKISVTDILPGMRPCPRPSPVPARAAIVSGASLLALGIGATALMATGLALSRSYDEKTGTDVLKKGYRANGLAYAGGISMVMLIPGAVLLGVGLKYRTKRAASHAVHLSPTGVWWRGRF